MIKKYLLTEFWEHAWSKPFYPILQFIYTKINPFFRSLLQSRVKVKEDPIYILVTTTVCNAKCIFCPYKNLSHQLMTMTPDTFNVAVNQLKEVNAKNICLSPTVGEALLNPHIFDYIKILKDNGMLSYIYSNGIALNINDNYKKLVDTEINEIHISLGDLNPKYESEIYGISLKEAKNKLKGIQKMIAYNDKVKKVKIIRLEFRTSRNPYNVLQESMFKKIKNKMEYAFALGYDNWGGSITQDDLVGSMKLTNSIEKINVACDKLKNTSILPNGDVRLCGCRFKKTLNDDLVVGNIHISTLKKMLTNKKSKDIFKKFENGDYPEVCKNCSFYQPDSK